jgi:endo-1,4-beta-xylanase
LASWIHTGFDTVNNIKMLMLSLFTISLAAIGTLAIPFQSPHWSDSHLAQRQVTPNKQGEHEGYFYYWWNDGESRDATYNLEPKGAYSMSWKLPGSLFGGKGWKTGARRNITYSASIDRVNDGNSFLSIYGWTRTASTSRLIEYYVVESYGRVLPFSPDAQSRGSVVVDGATYNLFYLVRYPPGIGNTLIQYWAVRKNRRTKGTVDTGKFFDAWAAADMPVGDRFEWQIVATEAYNSNGTSRVAVLSPP